MTNLFDITESPITEPESLLIGNFVQWRRLLDYSDSAFSVYYEVQGDSVVTITGTYDSTNEWWTFDIGDTAGDFTGLSSGNNVRWDLYVERTADSVKALISSGTFVVHQTTDDRRTHAEIMVAKIESVLENRADHDVESYTIKNRSLTRMSVKELRQWRDFYIAEVARTGGSVTDGDTPKTNTLRVRFI